MTERLHFHFSLACIGEGNGNPLQCSCLENPRDGGAWWAAVYGVPQSRTRLKWLSIAWRPPRPSKTNTKRKRCPFHQRGFECKSKKSRDTWSNRPVCHWSTAKASGVLLRAHTGHSKHPLPTTQETALFMDNIRWSILTLWWENWPTDERNTVLSKELLYSLQLKI